MLKSSILCPIARAVLIALLIATAAPGVTGAIEELPGAVRTDIKRINRVLKKAIEVLEAERLNTARRKLREAKKLHKQITDDYAGKFSKDEPTYKAMTERLAEVVEKIAEAENLAREVVAKSKKLWQTNDALCKSWIARLGPFVDRESDLYLPIGAELNRASAEDQARSTAGYPRAKALFEECQKVTFPLGRSRALQNIESRLATVLRHHGHGAPPTTQQGASRQGAHPLSGDVSPGRGHRWVRSHPLTMMALTIMPTKLDAQQYRQANLNTLLAWKAFDELLEKAVEEDLPWQLHINPHHHGLTERRKANLKRLYETYPGCTGWMVWDEVIREHMFTAAPTLAWLRKTFPGTLVYSNGLPPAGDKRMYGGDPPGGRYTYEQYQNDFVNIMNVDVLSYDAYRFHEDGTTGTYFPVMADTRKVGLKHDVPYWTIVQSFKRKKHGMRAPSESDHRMQVFAHLAFGFTGITYFTYAQMGPDGGNMVTKTGQRTPQYYDVARLNQEVRNVGQALRFLTSTDVRVVIGPGGKLRDGPHEAFRGAVAWKPGAGDEHRVTDVTIDDPVPDDYKHVLLGFFRDDDGRRYLMVCNLWHGKDASAAERALTVTLTLDPKVKVIGRLSRETGQPELLAVTGGKFRTTLPGGTGDLMRLGDAEFPGVGQD